VSSLFPRCLFQGARAVTVGDFALFDLWVHRRGPAGGGLSQLQAETFSWSEPREADPQLNTWLLEPCSSCY
jgi:hypothetical protein